MPNPVTGAYLPHEKPTVWHLRRPTMGELKKCLDAMRPKGAWMTVDMGPRTIWLKVDLPELVRAVGQPDPDLPIELTGQCTRTALYFHPHSAPPKEGV